MEKDVVCGMQVDPVKAAGTSQLDGKTYYFCSKVCKTRFDASPENTRSRRCFATPRLHGIKNGVNLWRLQRA